MPLNQSVAETGSRVSSRQSQISIIICTRGRCAELRETLASLSEVHLPSHLIAELIIIENGSKGQAETLTASFKHANIMARYFFDPKPGKSNALNRAIAESTGRILLFTDDDVRFPNTWVVDMCTPLICGEGAVVVGGCALAPHLQRRWMTHYHLGFLACTDYLSEADPSEFAGVNFACLRDVFLKVPGFDRELGGGGLGNCEDSLFARQLKQAGFSFIPRTAVRVEHFLSASRLSYGDWLRAASCAGRSQAYVMHHWDHREIRCINVRRLYFQLKLWARALLHRRQSADSEGIPAWELSYRVDIAKIEHFLEERNRPRHYVIHGLRKLEAGRQTILK